MAYSVDIKDKRKLSDIYNVFNGELRSFIIDNLVVSNELGGYNMRVGNEYKAMFNMPLILYKNEKSDLVNMLTELLKE